jgi:hypothetical protein
MNVPNKLVWLLMTGFFNLVLCLWVNPGAYPRVEHLKRTFIGPTRKLRKKNDCCEYLLYIEKKFARDKRSSLFRRIVRDEEKRVFMTSNQGRQELADEPGGDDLISPIPFISDVYALLSGLILAPRLLIENHFADRRFVDTPGLKSDFLTKRRVHLRGDEMSCRPNVCRPSGFRP